MRTFEFCAPIFSHVQKKGLFYSGDIILSKLEGITLDKYISANNIKPKFYSDLAFCFNTLFDSGIFNMDMNLRNIIFNEQTQKISFIDFDKLIINPNKKGNKKFILEVLSKFKKSLNKFNLGHKFDWDEFTR
jgi:tRNA A-37 threonylcarbamoyl transferase component Bud32